MTPEGNLSMLAKQKNHKPAEKIPTVFFRKPHDGSLVSSVF
jgi:hypothetical protein